MSRRFCLITTFYPPYHFGGDAIFVYRLANELARRGQYVEVVHCVDAYRLLTRGEPTGHFPHHPNVVVHRLQSRFGRLSPLATQQLGAPVFKAAALKAILNRGFDVIHYHNISLVGGPGLLGYGQGIKLYTPHEYWLVCPTHILFKHNREACVQPTCLSCTLAHGRPPQLWRYTDLIPRSLRHVDAILAPSRFSLDMHRQRGLAAPLRHLPLFVPDAPVPPTPLSPPVYEGMGGELPERPYFLFVGRLERLKGLHTLIPVFQRYPQADLWIAGTGREEARLRQMAAGAPNIRFLGQQPEAVLRTLYRQAVALIMPSLCYEVAPLTMVEAFQQGTPAIVRRLGAMAEMVMDTGGGYTYATAGELVRAMDALLADAGHRHTLGQAGYAAYQREWSADVHMTRYLGVIEEIAGRRIEQG